MPSYDHAMEHERAVFDWVGRWMSQRTLREVRHFLVVVELMKDEHVDAGRLVDERTDGGTLEGLVMAVTSAIAYLVKLPTIEHAWANDLITPHEDAETGRDLDS